MSSSQSGSNLPKNTDNKPEELIVQNSFVSRGNRFHIGGLHNISFRVQVPNQKSFVACTLNNLSHQGLAFQFVSQLPLLQEGSNINAEIILDDTPISIVLTIRHFSQNGVGCELFSDKAEFKKHVDEFLVDEIKAVEMIEVSSDKLKKDSDGNGHYFTTPDSSCTLYYAENNGKVNKIHINVLGNTINLSPAGEISYGFVLDEGGPDSIISVKVSSLPPEIINHAMRFITNIKSLPDNHREQVVTLIEDAKYFGPADQDVA